MCGRCSRRRSTDFGRLDILVNNAAILTPLSIRSSSEISLEEFDRVLKVNVRGTFQCAREAAPHLRRSGGGKIVNISSTTAFGGPPMMHYIASKGAVISMTYADGRRIRARQYLRERACRRVHRIGKRSWTTTAGHRQGARNRSAPAPIKRSMFPGEVAKAMLFLVTDESDFVTGHTMIVDGGFVMR